MTRNADGPADHVSEAPRALCAGHVNWDVTMQVERLPEPDGERPIDHLRQAGGGSAANVATGLSGFGVRAELFGSVGDDDPGTLTLRELDRTGVDCDPVSVREGRQTSVKYLIVDAGGEVMVLSASGANEAYTAADLPAARLADLDHLHLTGQDPKVATELARTAADHGAAVSFDPGRRIGDRGYTSAFEHVDVLLVNRREAATLEESGFDSTATDAPILVVKLGSEGAAVRDPTAGAIDIVGDADAVDTTGTVDTADRDLCRAPAFPVDPVDTTGAGDAFAAGFIAACFESARGREPEIGNELAGDVDAGDSTDLGGSNRGIPGTTAPHLRDADLAYALRIGNAAGALATREYGARTTLTWDRIDAFIADHDLGTRAGSDSPT
ncbi:ribokinase [Halopenitus malekzadehii]|uniref:Ribokinase n=1 Tax=Halopenitus malekzadehii TaxID=1267564 RepID=A0A1H6IZA3_9EURY|nr:PfkB family carbohydrate kinase [Halopenitus malekzadehii]SEH51918.1 ribokinase [Halopenitus malekzadehii]